ncbi:hypothetical protein HK104_004729 [Borealophlyctis nickersoniae]|nr:hypothetical protein HK104_004729 [Borealophlyctis nickersoniae]
MPTNTNLAPNHIIAVPFLLGGAWCLLHPSSVLAYATGPKFIPRNPKTADEKQAVTSNEFSLRCFGSQAIISGTAILLMKPTRIFYKVYGAMLVPFFVFDWMAVKSGSLNRLGGIVDFVGNVVMMAACWWGLKQ